jgi:hypothetical protein
MGAELSAGMFIVLTATDATRVGSVAWRFPPDPRQAGRADSEWEALVLEALVLEAQFLEAQWQ